MACVVDTTLGLRLCRICLGLPRFAGGRAHLCSSVTVTSCPAVALFSGVCGALLLHLRAA